MEKFKRKKGDQAVVWLLELSTPSGFPTWSGYIYGENISLEREGWTEWADAFIRPFGFSRTAGIRKEELNSSFDECLELCRKRYNERVEKNKNMTPEERAAWANFHYEFMRS